MNADSKTAKAKVDPNAGLKGAKLGMVIFIIGSTLLIAIDLFKPCLGLIDTIGGWQSLIAGAFALLAAGYAGNFISLQIAQAQASEQSQLERDLRASRAVLPLSLSLLTEHVDAIATGAREVVESSSGEKAVAPASGVPVLAVTPVDTVAELKAFVRAAPEEPGEAVACILSELQVLRSIARSEWSKLSQADEGGLAFKASFEAILVRAGMIQAAISLLWPYARRETDDAPGRPSRNDVVQALKLLRLEEDTDPRIFRILDNKLAGRPMVATSPVAMVKVGVKADDVTPETPPGDS